MTARNVITSQAILWFIVAAILVIYPELLLSFFGSSSTPFTTTLARIFGSELMGLALVSWFTRNTLDSVSLNQLLLSYFVSNSLGFIACAYGRWTGALLRPAWLLIASYLLYALLFAYLRFIAPRRAKSLSRRRPGKCSGGSNLVSH